MGCNISQNVHFIQDYFQSVETNDHRIESDAEKSTDLRDGVVSGFYRME